MEEWDLSPTALGRLATLRESMSSTDLAGAVLDALSLNLPALGKLGVANVISDGIGDKADRIYHDLEFVDGGGILIVAKVETVRTDAGEFQSLVGDRISYLGIGSSPVAAQLAAIGNDVDPFYVPQDGGSVDVDESVALWVTRGEDGQFVIWHQSLDSLIRETMSLYAKRVVENFDWTLDRDEEFRRVCAIAVARETDAQAAQLIRKIEQDREALAEAIRAANREIDRLRKEAAQAELNLVGLRALRDVLSLASAYQGAIKGLGPESAAKLSGAKSVEDIFNRLDQIRQDANSGADGLSIFVSEQTKNVGQVEVTLTTILTERNVPVENIPPGVRPPLQQK